MGTKHAPSSKCIDAPRASTSRPRKQLCSSAVEDASTFCLRVLPRGRAPVPPTFVAALTATSAAATRAFPKPRTTIRRPAVRHVAEPPVAADQGNPAASQSSPTRRGRHGPSFPKFESNRPPGETQSELVWAANPRHFWGFSFDTNWLRRLNYRNNGTSSCAGVVSIFSPRRFLAAAAKLRTAREQQITSADRGRSRFL